VDKLLVVEFVNVKSTIVFCFGKAVSLALIPNIRFNKLLSKIIFSSLFRSIGLIKEYANAMLLF
jgi:hypothetical protein